MSENTITALNWLKDSLKEIKTPFDGDLWDRQPLADRLQDYVSRLNVGATIALDAEWGAGKSWFVRNWQAQLEQNKFDVVYLNAFNQDYIDDPFITISMEIANCIKDQQSDFEAIKEVIGNTYRAILPSLPMLLWTLTTSLAGMGAFAKEVADIVENVKNSGELSEKAGELLNEKLKEHLSAQVENYENEKQSLEYFKSELTRITQDFDKPLVFIVDELDRCKPEFAIRLIERIKHFFDIPNVVFVLAINKKQLEESINSFYGFTSAANYLEKFIDFSIMLKNQDLTGERYEQILRKYNENLGLGIKTSQRYGSDNLKDYITICKVYTPNPRQLIRIINKFSLLSYDLNERQSLFLFIVLIYNELKLINHFNEKGFLEDFVQKHKSFFSVKYKEYEQNLGTSINQNNYRDIFLEFLTRNIYSSNQDYLDHFFAYIEHFLYKNEHYSHAGNDFKLFYYPVTNKSNMTSYDLIDEWQKYIHMIS